MIVIVTKDLKHTGRRLKCQHSFNKHISVFMISFPASTGSIWS